MSNGADFTATILDTISFFLGAPDIIGAKRLANALTAIEGIYWRIARALFSNEQAKSTGWKTWLFVALVLLLFVLIFTKGFGTMIQTALCAAGAALPGCPEVTEFMHDFRSPPV